MKNITKTSLFTILLILIGVIAYYTYPNNPEYVNYKKGLLAIEALEHNDMPAYFRYKDTPYTIKHDNLESTNLAYKYAMTGNYERAIEIINAVKNKQTYRTYGGCIETGAPFRFACAMFAKMMNNNYYEIDKNFKLSYIYTMQENYEEALKFYQYSNTKKPCHEAFLYAKLKNNTSATKALSQCNKDDQIALVRGLMSENQGNNDEALKYYFKSIKCQNIDTLLNLATKYKEMGIQPQANQYAHMILKQYPYHKKALEIIR